MNNITAHLELLVCNLIWACAYPLYNFVLKSHIDPLPLLTATMIFSALLSLTSLITRGEEEHRVEARDILPIVAGALLIALLRKGMLMFGLSLTTSVDAPIISTTTPVVVLVISVLLGLEHFSRRKSLGVLLGLGGAIGVILTGGSASGEAKMLGNLLILGCALISAIYMLWFKGLLRRYSPLTITRWMFCVAAVAVIPFGIEPLLHVDVSGWSPKVWLAVGYLVVMPTYLPNLLLTSALRRVPPTVTSIYTYVQPVVAVTISVVVGLDRLHPLTALFAVMIFAGVWIVIRRPVVE